jgi:hypothetical protein
LRRCIELGDTIARSGVKIPPVEFPAFLLVEPCTPPVENSNPEGGPKGADGQGACTFKLTIRYPDSWHGTACLFRPGWKTTFYGLDAGEVVELQKFAALAQSGCTFTVEKVSF